MRTVFADSGYWIALSNPHDELHERAKTASQSRIPRIVTSQMVLVEFLTSMGGRRQHLRSRAVEVVSRLREDPNVEIVPQTDAQFESAIAMYSSRLDKEWSLTDCASFVLMEQMNIREALAHDHNFEQAGFIALLRQI
jgi:predicted nucleic acid-binding protein